MALRYLVVAIVAALVAAGASAAVLAFVKRRRAGHAGGLRVANAQFAESLPAAKSRQRAVSAGRAAISAALACALASALVLVGRPSSVTTVSDSAWRKDIFICMDASASIADINGECVKALHKVVDRLDGEHIGIVIFNTDSLVFVPLTDDYDYVHGKLDELDGFFRAQSSLMSGDFGSYLDFSTYDDWQTMEYYSSALTLDSESKGSSLIGEGLATALYSFPGLDDEHRARSRTIIMTTDNAQETTEATEPPIVEFPKAAELCAGHGVKVYGIFPAERDYYILNTVPYHDAYSQFSEGIGKTGGEVFQPRDSGAVKSIVGHIGEQEVAGEEGDKKVRFSDIPEIPFALLVASLAALFLTRAVTRT